MKRVLVIMGIACLLAGSNLHAQLRWINADTAFGVLPEYFHVYKTTDSLDGKPFIAYYAEAMLKDKKLNFTADTSKDRRLTPMKFYEKNGQPVLVVNCTFFSYETNRSLNVVIKEGQTLAYNTHTIPMKGKDTFQYRHPFGSAIGINKKRKADVAWLLTDSSDAYVYASQQPVKAAKDSAMQINFNGLKPTLKKWAMKTAVGGGPVLLQNGQVNITNNEELKFNGKAIEDKHPRTCMGYTKDNRLIVMVIQGRFPGIAEGATLEQEARLLASLGCVEALNLDGGGSSCMLINGKETITPSDKVGERGVPAVFIIKQDVHK